MAEEWRCAIGSLVIFIPIICFYVLYNYFHNHRRLSREVKIITTTLSVSIIGGSISFLLPVSLQIGILVLWLLAIWISVAIHIWDWQNTRNRKQLHIWYDKRKAAVIVFSVLILCSVFFTQDYDYHLYRTDDPTIAVQEHLLRYLLHIMVSSVAIFNLLWGLPNNLIIEDGVYIPLAGIVKWADILSYRWESKKGNMLILKVKRNLKVWGEISLPIAPHYKTRVRKLLQEYR
jgi:hypothetical protein